MALPGRGVSSLLRRGARHRPASWPVMMLGLVVLASATLGMVRNNSAANFMQWTICGRESLQRRNVLTNSLLGTWAVTATVGPREAKAAVAVTDKDLERISKGYKGMVYLMDNWNKETRDCKAKDSDVTSIEVGIALQSGVASPDNCKPKPDNVRRYLGMRSINDNLYNTQQLWVSIQNQDLVDSKDDERFANAVEDFEEHKRQASEWAYTSSWGEANPGGGRDKVEDYLLRAKNEAALATRSLGVIVDVLKLKT